MVGCDKPRHGHGWCQMHYTRWRAHGDPAMILRDLTRSDEERFWAVVDKSAGHKECWLWTGGRGEDGHGCFSVKSVDVYAHRWLWEHLNGPIPVGGVVRHSCDNPPCVNPRHLLGGTQLDNIDDRNRRGRTAHGSKHYLAKLTETDVRDIRRRLLAGASRQELADRYEVSRAAIRAIDVGRSWKHVSIAS